MAVGCFYIAHHTVAGPKEFGEVAPSNTRAPTLNPQHFAHCELKLYIVYLYYLKMLTVDSLIIENEKKGVLMCIWQNKCRSQVSKKGVLEE